MIEPWIFKYWFGSRYRKLHTLYIEPTNRCNVACVFCPRAQITRPKGFMDWALYSSIIDQAAALGVKTVRLLLYGEPLLHPDLLRMVTFAKKRGLLCDFNTNGMRLSAAMAEGLIRGGLDEITFSVDSINPETYERLRPGGKFSTVLGNVERFKMIRRSAGARSPKITIQTMRTTLTRDEDVVSFFGRFADRIIIAPLSDRNGVIDGVSQLQVERAPPGRTRLCTYLWGSVAVYWNGDVTACCADFNGVLKLGSLQAASLEGLAASPRLVEWRQIHLAREFHRIPFCATCDSGALRSRIIDLPSEP